MEHPSIANAARFSGVVPHFRTPGVARTSEYYRDVLGFEIAGYRELVLRDCDGRVLAFGEDRA